MLTITHRIPNPGNIVAWLEAVVRPALRPDVSRYARGRLRVWLGPEPMLFAPFDTVAGFPVHDGVTGRLAELIGWPFDFCLVTYSGDAVPVGIAPHMDAGYADFEARSLHLSGECRFDYWASRETLGRSPVRINYVINRQSGLVELVGRPVEPTARILLAPGDVAAFNSKCPHAAAPGVKRWNLNFWRKKPHVGK